MTSNNRLAFALTTSVVLVAALAAYARGRQTVIVDSNNIHKGTVTVEGAFTTEASSVVGTTLSVGTTATVAGSTILSAAVYIDGGVTFRNATAPATLFGDLGATTATSSVPVFQVVPTATLDTNDLIFAVKDVAGGSNRFSVDLEGDVVGVKGTFSGAVAGTTITGSAGVQGTTLKATSTTTAGTITLGGQSPATGTATVVAGTICLCSDASVAELIKCALSSTTLTATGPNSSVATVNYICL